MGGVRGRYRGEERCREGCGQETKNRDHLEDLEVDIKTDYQEPIWIGVDWTDVAQSRGKRRAVANTLMKFRTP
jgi:hypothetical protein